MDWGSQLQLVLEVVIAMVFGGIVGLERELADKPAGLRTHMLTAGAAAFLVGLAIPLMRHLGALEAPVEGDPIRIMQAIIIGVSFIGAGTIFRGSGEKGGDHVEGLTTAASLLISASLGIAAALQQYLTGTLIAVLSLLVLRVMKNLGNRLS